jgi:hypothetical protein
MPYLGYLWYTAAVLASCFYLCHWLQEILGLQNTLDLFQVLISCKKLPKKKENFFFGVLFSTNKLFTARV